MHVPPVVTAPPSALLVARRLIDRQDAVQTCGWISANPNNPATCSVGSTCAVNTVYNVHFCCPSFPCTPPTTCLGYLAVQTACDSACQENPLILKCPSTYDYCYTRTWHEATPLSGFGCASSPFFEDVYTTNSLGVGQIAAGSTFGVTVTTAPVTTTSPSSLTPSSTSGSASTSGSGASGPNTSSTSHPSWSGGKIAGVAIGSFAGAVIVGFILMLAVKWMKKKKPAPPKPEPDVPLEDFPSAPSRPSRPSAPSASSASFAQAPTEFEDETESVAPLRPFDTSMVGANRWSMPGDGQSSSARSDLSEGEQEAADADYRRYASLRRQIQEAASTV